MAHFRRFFTTICFVVLFAAPAAAQLDSEANAAVHAWVDAVASGDSTRIEAILAPEFQIQRADGSAYSKADYVAGGFARITDVLDIADVVATRAENVMVVRYMLVITETIGDRPAQTRAPRLTVFRRVGDNWLVSAHANFARVGS